MPSKELTLPNWGPGWVAPLSVTPPSGLPSALPIADSLTAGLGLPFLWGWQRQCLAVALERVDGHWKYRTIVVVVSRQNGKTTMIGIRVLIGLMLGEKMMFAQHDRQKGREKWIEIADLIEAHFGSEVSVHRRLGDEHVRHRTTGAIFKLVTPTSAGARSFTADTVFIDESAFISPEFISALRPTMVTREGAQIWMVSSAGTDKSWDLARARNAALTQLTMPAKDRTYVIVEWGITKADNWALETTWAKAIPTLGHKGGALLSALRDDFEGMALEDFGREYLGVWTGNPLDTPIDQLTWTTCQLDVMPEMTQVVLAVDTDPQQRWASIALAGLLPDGMTGVALASHQNGDSWLPEHLTRAYQRHRPVNLVIDGRSPAASLAAKWKAKGRPVHITTATEMAASCAGFVSLLRGDGLRVARDDTLTAAAMSAVRRPVAEGWAFNRRSDSEAPISPIVAAALASHRRETHPVHPGARLWRPTDNGEIVREAPAERQLEDIFGL